MVWDVIQMVYDGMGCHTVLVGKWWYGMRLYGILWDGMGWDGEIRLNVLNGNSMVNFLYRWVWSSMGWCGMKLV